MQGERLRVATGEDSIIALHIIESNTGPCIISGLFTKS